MIAETNAQQFSNFLYNIGWLRRYYRIPKKRMAQLLGISVRTLNKLEAGSIPPKVGIDIIFQLHKQFRYPMGTLFQVRLPHDIPAP